MKTQVAECNFLNTTWTKVESMTLARVERIKLFSKVNVDPMIMSFPCSRSFSWKQTVWCQLLSKSQSIAIELEINSNRVSELGKDLDLVGEKMFGGFHFLLDLHSRVSFSLQLLSSSFGAMAEGKHGSSWAMEQRSVSLSLLPGSPTSHRPYP